MDHQVVLLGGAMSPLTKLPEGPGFDLVTRTIFAALADAGVAGREVQGLAITPPGLSNHNTAMFVSRLNAHLGWELRSLACLENGGCSSALALRWAMAEIEAGRCDLAVAVGADQRTPTQPEPGETFESFMDRMVFVTAAIYGAYEGPYGIGAPIPYYAMSAQRYLHETGQTGEDLAWAAVRLREHAHRHELAMFRDKPLAVDDVLNSGDISPPLHLADCSQFVTGAAAVVLGRAEAARGRPHPAVGLRGWGQAHHPSAFSSGAPSLTRFPALERAAGEAYERAGVGPGDIDVAEIYGVFSSHELMLCEALGFCERGRAGAAFRAGQFSHGGELVVDPSGGRLSLGHPACATPLIELVEIGKQLQGRAGARQVPDARLGLMHAEHGMLNGNQVSIWERRE